MEYDFPKQKHNELPICIYCTGKYRHMKITVQDGNFAYSYDSGVCDRVQDGELIEYFPPVEEAVDAAVSLLWGIYGKKKVAEALLTGIPAMDYSDKTTNR